MADGQDIKNVIIGVDCGGTNTDAVVLCTESKEVLASAKTPTTRDVTSGVKLAVESALTQARMRGEELGVLQVNIGTTHFVNALVQRRNLAKVSVIRLCGTASRKLPPFCDFPKTLCDCVKGDVFLADGGYQFDGREITAIDEAKIVRFVDQIRSSGVKNIVISGVFSPVKFDQEVVVGKLAKEHYSEVSVTLSHTIGHIGILERENAAILNESIKPLCRETIAGFRKALDDLGLQCPFYLTQNDGTIINENTALKFPVHTFASGPTNSMRGAAFLSGKREAVIVDIGGTTTDVGLLRNGFPREASSEVKIGEVRTNFRMPDVLSIGLGGGSYVTKQMGADGKVNDVSVGPLSAGYNIVNEALVFGEVGHLEDRKITASDIAVAAGLVDMGTASNVSHLSRELIDIATKKMRLMVENVIDQVKLTDQSLDVILVGGGSVLIDREQELKGASSVITPPYFDVANAIGAALSQVSGSVDYVDSVLNYVDQADMDEGVRKALKNADPNLTIEEKQHIEEEVKKKFFASAREKAVSKACDRARDLAEANGAHRDTLEIVEKYDIPLAYLPGNANRLKVKVIGDLVEGHADSNMAVFSGLPYDQDQLTLLKQKASLPIEKQNVTSTGRHLDEKTDITFTETDKEPRIDTEKGEWLLSKWDIECISIGAGILGCGGGGSPYLGKLLALKAIEEGKSIRVVTPDRLLAKAHPEKDRVVVVAFMGAPVIFLEKLTAGNETIGALHCLQDLYTEGGFVNGKLENADNVDVVSEEGVVYVNDYQPTKSTRKEEMNIVALISAEIGGMNCIEPLLVGAELGLPIVDCDGMGRAFPELQMYCPLIYGSSPYPATLADDKGRRAAVLQVDSAKHLENHFRRVVVEMGCSGGVVISSLNKQDVMNHTVKYSLSRAWRLGGAVLQARLEKMSTVDTICRTEGGKCLIVGKIYDVLRETTGGFNKGNLKIEGLDSYSGQRIVIDFQNENLLARHLGSDGLPQEVLACVPDLITLVDSDTGQPITTEDIRYGLRVSVLALPAPPLLTTEQGLHFVGPQAFGYSGEIQYAPFGRYVDPAPVSPM